jgi:hypothetical protein
MRRATISLVTFWSLENFSSWDTGEKREPRITKKIWMGSMTALIAVIITVVTLVLGG